jgi:hypothetical protein
LNIGGCDCCSAPADPGRHEGIQINHGQEIVRQNEPVSIAYLFALRFARGKAKRQTEQSNTFPEVSTRLRCVKHTPKKMLCEVSDLIKQRMVTAGQTEKWAEM